jgi:type IV secretion system protein VirB10
MNNSLIVLDPRHQQSDPRIELEPETLALAKRNAFPLVAQQTRRKDGMGLAVGGAGALLLGIATFAGLSGSREVAPSKPAAAVPATQTQPGAVAIPPEAMTGVPAAGGAPVAIPGQGPVLAGDPAAPPTLVPDMVVNRHGAPALILDSSGPEATAPASTVGVAGDEGFGSAGTQVAKATRMKNPGQTVSQGTLIPAVLETAINSDLPGYVRAVVSSDIRSFDGSRVLVPRSSRLIGQYKSGVAGGQTRAYVMWTRLIRPDGVSVALASPAVD